MSEARLRVLVGQTVFAALLSLTDDDPEHSDGEDRFIGMGLSTDPVTHPGREGRG